MERKLKEGLLVTLAAGLLNQGCASPIELLPNMHGEIGPSIYYSLKKNRCAAYAVRVAREHYGKNMTYQDAWNIPSGNRVIASVENEKHLKELIMGKTLTPGMIVAFNYSESSFLDGVDWEGKPRRYTHLAVFAGTDSKGEAIFHHKFQDYVGFVTLKGLRELNSTPVEIIDEN